MKEKKMSKNKCIRLSFPFLRSFVFVVCSDGCFFFIYIFLFCVSRAIFIAYGNGLRANCSHDQHPEIHDDDASHCDEHTKITVGFFFFNLYFFFFITLQAESFCDVAG